MRSARASSALATMAVSSSASTMEPPAKQPTSSSQARPKEPRALSTTLHRAQYLRVTSRTPPPSLAANTQMYDWASLKAWPTCQGSPPTAWNVLRVGPADIGDPELLAHHLPAALSKTSAQTCTAGKDTPVSNEAHPLADGSGNAITTLAGTASARHRATSNKDSSSAEAERSPCNAASKAPRFAAPGNKPGCHLRIARA
mmetsp:Transcript_54725/g.169469  ORF Transcript_54725/g.169469 Transcript_54725/m.169469 type:complete len:200 (+) Transcript_54725:281-880(+)